MTREEEIHKIANTISTNIGKDVDEDYTVYVRDNRKSDCFVVTKG